MIGARWTVQARNVMTPNPSVVTRDATVARAARLMRDRHIDILPVIDNLRTRHLVGVLTDRAIVRPVSDLMTEQPLAVVHVDTKPEDVIALMSRRHLRRIPVLDEKERLVGVIALADLTRRMQSPDARAFAWTTSADPSPDEAAVR